MFSNIILLINDNISLSTSHYSIFRVVVYSPFSILFEDIKNKKRHWVHIKTIKIIKQL
jgi:hypothetical protein